MRGALFFLVLSLAPSAQSAVLLKEENEKTLKKVSTQIEARLQEKTGGADLKVYFDPSARRLLPLGGDFKLTDVSFNPETKRFIVKIVFGDQPTLVLKGRVSFLQKIPMVSRPIEKGEKIQEADVVWALHEETPFSRRAASQRDLADATPRHKTLEPGTLITAQDIQKPIFVEQGSTVTVIYEKKGLHVVTLGKALDAGAKGDTIRVQNQESKKIFSATVENKSQAKVILTTGR